MNYVDSSKLSLTDVALTLDRRAPANGYDSPWTHSPHVLHASVMDDNVLLLLGARIRERRKARAWTQEHLAAEAHLDRSYLGGVERGERNVTFSVLCEICRALECDVATMTKGIPELRS